MLSSRYLHLHEALGLGPMWFNQNARFVHTASENSPETMQSVVTQSAAATSANSKQSTSSIEQKTTAAIVPQAAISNENLDARQATMAALKVASQPMNEPKTTQIVEQRPSEDQPFSYLPTDIRIAKLMVVSICPAPEDNIAGQLFSGDSGILLNNMLAAIGLSTDQVHKTSWVKNNPLPNVSPTIEAITATLQQIILEKRHSQAKAILLLGQIFEQSELEPLIVELCGQLPYFIVPHPARLLRRPQLKQQAWQQLKKLRQII